MRKRVLLLALPFLLATSCSEGKECPEPQECPECPTLPEPDPINDMLKELANGFKAESKLFVTQDFGLNSAGEHSYSWYTVCKDVDVSGDYIYSKQYSSEYFDSEEVEAGDISYVHDDDSLEETCIFTKNNEDNKSLSTISLGIDNKIHYSDVINSDSNLAFEFSKTFANPFAYLTEDDFTKKDDNTYELKEGEYKLSTIYNVLANYIMAEPLGYSVQSLTLTTDGSKITGFSGEFVPDSSSGWTLTETITFETTITHIGADSFTAPSPLTGSEDATLKSALDSLKANNYDVSSLNSSYSVWTETTTNSYVTGTSNGHEVIQQNYADNVDPSTGSVAKEYYFDGYQEDYWGTMRDYTQKSVKIGNEYYYCTNRVEAAMSETMLPTFDISPLLFDKVEDGKYTLKTNLPYYFVLGKTDVFSIFRSNSMETLTITLGTDEVTFETVGGDYVPNETTTYSNIGKVSDTLVDKTKVNETADGKLTTILDYVALDSDKEKLKEAIGEEQLSAIPTPGGVCTDVSISASSLSTQFRFALDLYDPDVQYDDLLVHYSNALTAGGFTFDPTYTSGYMFEKSVSFLGVNYTYEVSFGISGSYFVVDADLVR